MTPDHWAGIVYPIRPCVEAAMEELSQRVAAAQASADAAAAASKATDALKAGEGGGGEDELDSFMAGAYTRSLSSST